MKAVAVFPGSREVKIIEHEVPRLSEPDQVMLRMLDVGICGTDKEICSFEYGTPPEGQKHLVIGHESVAEIVEVGSAVEHLHAGDLVVRMGRYLAGVDALRDLEIFGQRWPAVVPTLIAGRYPPEQAPDLILGRPAGIKSVIAFGAPS
jgi:NADPH:quinone reductase-like Zn-dependent oxidoreductase